jgi:hypothetical protein
MNMSAILTRVAPMGLLLVAAIWAVADLFH